MTTILNIEPCDPNPGDRHALLKTMPTYFKITWRLVVDNGPTFEGVWHSSSEPSTGRVLSAVKLHLLDQLRQYANRYGNLTITGREVDQNDTVIQSRYYHMTKRLGLVSQFF